MAKSAALWEGRRAMTDNPATSPEAYKAAARQLLELDQLSEASVFFALAGDDEGLSDIINKAAAEGNFFIFQGAAARLKNPKAVRRTQAETLLAAAEKNGRALDSEKAAAYLKDNF